MAQMAPADGEEDGSSGVRKWVWLVGGLCAATAGFLVWGPKRAKPVRELAQRIEDAWQEHAEGQDMED